MPLNDNQKDNIIEGAVKIGTIIAGGLCAALVLYGFGRKTRYPFGSEMVKKVGTD